MNGARGEVLAVLCGAERRLCLTLGALAELETAFGAETVEALAARLARLTLCAPPPAPRKPSGQVSAPNSPLAGTLWNTHLSSPVRTS